MIHISLIGKTKEPVIEGIKFYGNPSKVYLLHSKNELDFKFELLAKKVKKQIEENWCKTDLVMIKPFDMNNILETILNIIKKENSQDVKKEFFINVTGGTNLMAAAASTAAFIAGARAYYVLDPRKNSKENVIELPIPVIPKQNSLRKKQSEVLQKINEYGKINNKEIEIKLKMRPTEINYHLNELVKKNLITTKRGWEYVQQDKIKTDNRQLTIEITSSGKFIASYPELI